LTVNRGQCIMKKRVGDGVAIGGQPHRGLRPFGTCPLAPPRGRSVGYYSEGPLLATETGSLCSSGWAIFVVTVV